MAEFEKPQKEDSDLEGQINALDNAIDYHAKDNREKRKALQECRNVLAKQMELIQQSATGLQGALSALSAASLNASVLAVFDPRYPKLNPAVS